MFKRRLSTFVFLCTLMLLAAGPAGAAAGTGSSGAIAGSAGAATTAAVSTGAVTGTAHAGAVAPDSWTIYVYMCGSNLESESGSATDDLTEIFAAPLPPNVKVLIETGGTKTWHNSSMAPDKLQRFIHTGAAAAIQQVDEQPDANMSDGAVLKDFLAYGKEHFPAAHNMFIFWDHGGGSVVGAISDERFPGSSMSLNEMKAAFAAVYPDPGPRKPFDLIGFDTCLMATIDTARNFEPFAAYLAASEETEPSNGWNYTPWLTALAQNPKIPAGQLGRLICQSYLAGCEEAGTNAQATLSLIDLSKLDPLFKAYSAWGQEALSKAAANPGEFLTAYSRSALNSENYGGNRPSTGYTNMVDLGHLASQTAGLLPEQSQNVLSALDACVAYRVNGPYRSNSNGLSCYYLYGLELENLKGYFGVASASEPFKYLYSYMAAGSSMEDTVKEYLSRQEQKPAPTLPTLKTDPLENAPVTILDNGSAQLNLGAANAARLSSVRFMLVNVDKKDDLAIVLGFDNNIKSDWDKGVFTDNFNGEWGHLDHHPVYMDIVEENEDYTVYAVPIKLEGENYNLMVAYNYKRQAYDIIGARKGIDNYSTAAKGLRLLKAGDVITTVICAARLSTPNDLKAVDTDTWTLGEHPVFADETLTDPKENESFAFIFEMDDLQNNSAFSDVVFFTLHNGQMTLTDTLPEKN
jgi:hypothetical protein